MSRLTVSLGWPHGCLSRFIVGFLWLIFILHLTGTLGIGAAPNGPTYVLYLAPMSILIGLPSRLPGHGSRVPDSRGVTSAWSLAWDPHTYAPVPILSEWGGTWTLVAAVARSWRALHTWLGSARSFRRVDRGSFAFWRSDWLLYGLSLPSYRQYKLVTEWFSICWVCFLHLWINGVFFSVAANSWTGHIVFLWTNDIIFV